LGVIPPSGEDPQETVPSTPSPHRVTLAPNESAPSSPPRHGVTLAREEPAPFRGSLVLSPNHCSNQSAGHAGARARNFLRSESVNSNHVWEDEVSFTSSFKQVASLQSTYSMTVRKRRRAALERTLEAMTEEQEGCEQRSVLEDEVPMCKWLLVFGDYRYEKLYCQQVSQQLGSSLLTAYLVIMAYSLYAMYGCAISGHNLLVLEWGSAPNVAYNLYWLFAFASSLSLLAESCIFRNSQRQRICIREMLNAVFFSLILWFGCILGTRLRVAEILGEDSLDIFGTELDGGDELVLQTSVVVIYLAMHTHMRFKILLLPSLSGMFAYPVSTFMTSSGRSSFIKEIMTCLLSWIISVFVCLGQRKIEVMRRKHLLVRLESESQQAILQQQDAERRASAGVKKSKQQAIWKAVERRRHNMQRHQTDASRLSRKASTTSMRSSRRSGELHELPDPLPNDEAAREDSNTDRSREVVSQPQDLPNSNLSWALPEGVATDWEAVARAVSRIRDPAYSLKEFHEDMVHAFPELSLYTLTSSVEQTGEECSEEVLSSGRTRLEELARTFGAFHAIYWLMRLDLDGKQGFCFGYDDEWNIQPVLDSPSFDEVKTKRFVNMSAAEKKVNFYNVFPWVECDKLLTSAGLLKAAPVTVGVDADCVGQDRLKAMLVLTAIHDVMKNEAICPTVQEGHGPFCNYRDGQVIRDHDVALDYVMSFFGSVFPSYSGLDQQSQRIVKFTQGKMGFNNGWLVQGEAPPGALFHSFKRLIAEGGTNSEDVAFYFTHWVTDLAGAEPTPLSGSEKFVQKFPTAVLASFFRSFPHVWQLSTMTETQVYQEYLRAQWIERPSLGTLPAGEDSVALMRLALQAQSHADLVRSAFDGLPSEDRKVLVEEMARSGLPNQEYEGIRPRGGTPALLVYYAPAFLQKNGEQLGSALSVLAEVYRQGRFLFPLSGAQTEAPEERRPATRGGPEEQASGSQVHTVTLRIEQLKDLPAAEIVGLHAAVGSSEAEAFFLIRRGDLEAVVERKPLSAINGLLREGAPFSYLSVHGSTRKLGSGK